MRKPVKAFTLTILALIALAPAASAAMEPVWSHSSSGFKRLVIYYGWLNTSNLPNLHVDVLIVAGTSRILPGGGDYAIVQELRQRGVEVYAYLHDQNDSSVGLGSSFRSMVVENSTGSLEERYSYWLQYLERLVDRYVGVVDGVFLDECDPAFFTSDLNSIYVDYFTWGIGNLTAYAHSKGLKVAINGVMGYAGYADYYFWEEFVVGYNRTSETYYLIPDFLRSSSYQSPLEWVNGLSRYQYLRDKNLLDRTLAVAFVDPEQPETLEWARMAHALARIMGLAGWGYANSNFYASGGPVPVDVAVYEYGPPVSDPVIDESTQIAWRVFAAAGNVTVDYTGAMVSENLVYSTFRPMLDCVGNEYDNLLSGSATGPNSVMEFLGLLYTTQGLYIYVEWNYTDSASTGGLLHVYIDSDGAGETGYSVYGIGADQLVELYTDGNALLYNYTGSGSDWTWSLISSVDARLSVNGLSYRTELRVTGLELKPNVTRVVVAVVYNWADDSVAGPYTVETVYVVHPVFYEPSGGLEAYTGVIESVSVGTTVTTLVANGPSGSLVNYTVVLPYSGVARVEVNGVEVPQIAPGSEAEGYYWRSLGNGYIAVTVLALHQSPVEITIYPAPLPIPENSLLTAAAAIAVLALFTLLFSRRRLRSL